MLRNKKNGPAGAKQRRLYLRVQAEQLDTGSCQWNTFFLGLARCGDFERASPARFRSCAAAPLFIDLLLRSGAQSLPSNMFRSLSRMCIHPTMRLHDLLLSALLAASPLPSLYLFRLLLRQVRALPLPCSPRSCLLSPFLFVQLALKYYKFFISYALIILIYFIIHYLNGISNVYEYFKSLTLHTVVLILAVGFYNKLKKQPYVVAYAIEFLAFLNLIAVFLSLLTINLN